MTCWLLPLQLLAGRDALGNAPRDYLFNKSLPFRVRRNRYSTPR